jgi:hypothetical protein
MATPDFHGPARCAGLASHLAVAPANPLPPTRDAELGGRATTRRGRRLLGVLMRRRQLVRGVEVGPFFAGRPTCGSATNCLCVPRLSSSSRAVAAYTSLVLLRVAGYRPDSTARRAPPSPPRDRSAPNSSDARLRASGRGEGVRRSARRLDPPICAPPTPMEIGCRQSATIRSALYEGRHPTPRPPTRRKPEADPLPAAGLEPRPRQPESQAPKRRRARHIRTGPQIRNGRHATRAPYIWV